MTDTLEAPSATATTETVATSQDIVEAGPSTTAVALENCVKAYCDAHAVTGANGKSEYECVRVAGIAYRKALPTTSTLADIQAFIACVAQGINYRVYEGQESSQLLYAAQVALTAHKPPKPEKVKQPKPGPEK